MLFELDYWKGIINDIREMNTRIDKINTSVSKLIGIPGATFIVAEIQDELEPMAIKIGEIAQLIQGRFSALKLERDV